MHKILYCYYNKKNNTSYILINVINCKLFVPESFFFSS